MKVSDASKETSSNFEDKPREAASNGFEMNVIDNSKLADEKETKKEPEGSASLFSLFRFANRIDWLMMAIGTLGGVGSGASFPFMLIFFSDIIDGFTSFDSSFCDLNITVDLSQFDRCSPNVTVQADLLGPLVDQAINMCILAGVSLFLSYIQVAFWIMPAERQVREMRKKLFSSILKQEIGWFDTYKDGSLTNRLTDDINKVKDGINDKFGNAIQFISTFFAGVIISFIRGWKLTLIILAMSPLLFGASVVFTILMTKLTKNELKSYALAGSIAEEAISAIRTVFAFNGVQKEHQRYEKNLETARQSGIKRALFTGAMFGLIWMVIQCSYAVGFWFGWVLTKPDAQGNQEYTAGNILLVFFSIIIAVFSLGNAGPFISNIAVARGAAFKVFEIMDRKPAIDSESTEGIKPDELIGDVEFVDVEFNYPARDQIKILDKLSLKIKPGQTVALVGASGCGKSTCIQLIQRFYDPLGGQVLIDGHDVRDLNLSWLRTHLGVVNQEPVLFGMSIIENIRFGRDGVTEEEIVRAARAANAHNFIMDLPQKYDTLVGDRGSQLSGGQKQRIAIARALVRNPKILLLDEATSALDNQSEAIVQAALDQARLGRTTIVVAHRLSTIRNADLIYVLDGGRLVECGTHDELMKRREAYYRLVTAQQLGDIDKEQQKKALMHLKSNDDTDILGDKKEEEEGSKKKKKDKGQSADLKRMFMMNKPEWGFILLGCLASIVSGGVQPAFAVVFSKVIAVFSLCERSEQEKKVTLYCILFVVFGVATLCSNFLQSFSFGYAGENLTKRIRSKAFKSILTQEIGWFDLPENNVGTLTTKLAVEAAAVQGATGIRIGTVLMNLSNLGVGIILAFIYSWAVTLVILGFLPFLIIGGFLQTQMLTGFSSKDKEIIEEAGKMTSEAISNIRTVVILNKEKHFSDAYGAKIDIPYKRSIKAANLFAFMFAFTNSIVFVAIAAAFVVGGVIIDRCLFGLKFEDVMLTFNCVIFGAQSVGQASSLMPDYTKAKIAIVKICELFDRKPKINNWDVDIGNKFDSIEGDINFKSVQFSYPTRQEVKVLDNFDLTIKKGQRIALVGSSGCGKSTITQLLERFYDPEEGEVTVNGVDVRDISVGWLRSQIGIVSQEPILFDATIAENIAYGDNSRVVSMDEIVEAAMKANIHDFISNLPQGYNTNVGSKGTQLSGGQKQRVSIARALVRDPKILLLDEATSALDTESEKIVQEALERAQKGRTCIVIAHRLSTIRNSDLIFVIEKGKVTEVGTHDQLMQLNGFYAKLNNKTSDHDNTGTKSDFKELRLTKDFSSTFVDEN